MDRAILETGLAMVVAKQTAIEGYYSSVEYLDELANRLDDKYGKTYPCDGTIMCQRTGKRHKSGCIGRTDTVDRYVRGIQSC